jgi:predicted translation initiation factor SUI1
MPRKTLLLLAPDADKFARLSESAFAAAFHRLGLPWNVIRRESPIESTTKVIAFMESPGAEVWQLASETEIEPRVNQWIAALLGGGQPAPAVSPPLAAPKKVHTVKLSRETAGRRGKGVTVISELPLNEEQLGELATLLKNKCGTGGTAKDGRIEIQGDQRDRIAAELEKLGYKVKRAGG